MPLTVETLTTETAIDLFLQVLIEARGYAPATAKTYRAVLMNFAKVMELENIVTAGTKQIEDYSGRLFMAKQAASTRRRKIHTLKVFFRLLHARGHIETDPGKDVIPPADRRMDRVPTFTEDEIERICFTTQIEGPPQIRKGRGEPMKFFTRRFSVARLVEWRDSALLALVYSNGLRAGEVAYLERHDFDLETGYLSIRGEKWAEQIEQFPIDERVKTLMAAYLEELWRSPWADHVALFPPMVDRERTHAGYGLSDDAVSYILQKRIARAGIEPRGRRLSVHVLRYSFATHLFKDGAAPFELKIALRHKAISTVMRYVDVGSSKAVKKRLMKRLYWNRVNRVALTRPRRRRKK